MLGFSDDIQAITELIKEHQDKFIIDSVSDATLADINGLIVFNRYSGLTTQELWVKHFADRRKQHVSNLKKFITRR